MNSNKFTKKPTSLTSAYSPSLENTKWVVQKSECKQKQVDIICLKKFASQVIASENYNPNTAWNNTSGKGLHIRSGQKELQR